MSENRAFSRENAKQSFLLSQRKEFLEGPVQAPGTSPVQGSSQGKQQRGQDPEFGAAIGCLALAFFFFSCIRWDFGNRCALFGRDIKYQT